MFAGLLWSAYYWLVLRGADLRAYWTGTPDVAYRGFVLGDPVHAYTPVFVLAFAPLTALPFDLVWAAWSAVNLALAAWLLWPLPREWRLVGLLLLGPELIVGNVHVLIAAAVVLALRDGRGWAWALPLLTKVTPGVGLVWHLVRREWRPVGQAIGLTVPLVLLSAGVAPALWPRWWAAIVGNLGSPGPEIVWIPLLPRLPVAAALLVYAASRDRAWLVPVVLVLAAPHINLTSLALLAACPRLGVQQAIRNVRPPAGGLAWQRSGPRRWRLSFRNSP